MGHSDTLDGQGALPERMTLRMVFDLAWPIAVSMLSYTAMSVIDTVFVGRLGTAPLAAVGLAMTVGWMLQGFFSGLLVGLKIAISQRIGAQEHEAARRLVWQGLWLAGMAGALVAAAGPLGGHIFGLMGASEEVSAHTTVFLQILLLGAPLNFVHQAMNAWFHGNGETRLPMVATLMGNAINIVLDPLLIFGVGPLPALGIQGAALATLIGLGISALWLFARLRPALLGSAAGLCRDGLREIWRLGSPIGVRGLLESGSFALFTAMLARVGDADLAAHVIVIRIISVSFLPGYAIGEATSVLVGQAVGARRPLLARQALSQALRLAVGVMAVCGVVFWQLPEPLLVPFSAAEDVSALAVQLLLVAALFQIFDAVAMVSLCALNGAGDVRFSMIISVGTAWLIKLPVGWLLAIPLGLGAAGAWLGLTAEIVVVAGLAAWRLRGEAWLRHGPSDARERAAAK